MNLLINLIVLCCAASLFPLNINAAPKKISSLVNNGGYILKAEKNIFQLRANDPFIPASTIKILTSLAALDVLGRNYRFETHFFIDQNNNLYIKGFGDPLLTSETLLSIARTLRKRGVKELTTLYLDENSFKVDNHTPGSENSKNPYDAPNGALAVNFNSLPLLITPDGNVSSGEEQTPTLPMMHDIATKFPPGRYRLNVNSFADSNKISMPMRYTGELFIAQLRRAGIIVNGGFAPQLTPKELQPFFIFFSNKSLEEIVRLCLKYSNNFIANQLYLMCGAVTFKFPATWEKSHHFLTSYITNTLSLSKKQVHVIEGAGLSRMNTITPAALLQILEFFKPYAHLLNKNGNILFKSGTLTDVFCFAGYVQDNASLRPFVILLNQPENTRSNILNIFRDTFLQK